MRFQRLFTAALAAWLLLAAAGADAGESGRITVVSMNDDDTAEVHLNLAGSTGLSAGDLPSASSWYFHADLATMRTSAAGRDLHGWLDREVFSEVREESGIDLATEADRLTAFATNEDDVVILLEGEITSETEDKLMALAATADEFDSFAHRNRAYHFVRGDTHSAGDDTKVHIDLEDGVYFSFALDDKIVVTGTRERMHELLDNRGRVRDHRAQTGALFVLSAERSLVQAGVHTDSLAERGDGDDWDSSFLKSARQVAVLLADVHGKLAVEAQLVTVDAEKANALASIARGLIALQAFSDDMEPKTREVLQNVFVEVNDTVLKLSVALDPEFVVATLDD